MKGISIVGTCALLALAACGQDSTDSPSRSTADTHTSTPSATLPVLVELQPVVIPDLTERTAWLSAVHELSLDLVSGNLLAQDVQSGKVTEFERDGSHTITYGGVQGRGPDEISRLVGFGFGDTLVVLLDAGNAKVLAYTRSGTLKHTVPVAPNYRDISIVDGRTLLVPSAEGGVFDALNADGTVEVRGRARELPVRCEGSEECFRPPMLCSGCKMFGLSDSLVAIVNTEESIAATYRLSGERVAIVDFLQDHPVVNGWHLQDLPYLEETSTEGGAQVQMIKTYFISPQWVGGTKYGSAVAPSADEFRNRGYEYWIVDALDGSIERYGFPRERLGYLAVGTDTIFALDREDGGIYSLSAPR